MKDGITDDALGEHRRRYQELFPELELLDGGFLGRDQGWDDATWSLSGQS